MIRKVPMYPNQPQGYYAPQQHQQQHQQQYPQQQYPQQGYAPPAPAQQAPQQYAQPAADTMPPQFSDGGVYGSGSGQAQPAVRHLVGRTIALVPISYDPNAQFEGASRPSARADLYVIDGGPLVYGDNMRDGTPATHRIDTPCVFKGWTVSNINVVNEIRAGLDRRSMPVGVIYRSSFGQKPYNLGKIKELPDGGGPRPDGEQRWQNLQTVFDGLSSGQIPNPTPIELNPQQPGQNGAGAMQAYASQQQYQPQTVPGYEPTYAPPRGYVAPQQPVQAYGYAPAPAGPTLAGGPNPIPQPAMHPQYVAAQQQAAAPVSAPAAPAQQSAPLPPAPPGFEAIWHTMTDEQRGTLLQAQAARAAQQAPAVQGAGAPAGDAGPGF